MYPLLYVFYMNGNHCYWIKVYKGITQSTNNIWAPSSEFVSSSIPSWQILTAHAQPFRGARDLVFCLKVPLDSLLVWASSGGSGETARMRRLAWTFAARIGYKYQIRLTRSIYFVDKSVMWCDNMFPKIDGSCLNFRFYGNLANMSMYFKPQRTPFLYSKTGVFRGIHYFLIFGISDIFKGDFFWIWLVCSLWSNKHVSEWKA